MAVRKFEIARLQAELGARIDVFICCGSYEARCLSAAKALDRDRIAKAIIAENEDLSVYVHRNSECLRDLFRGKQVSALINSGDPLRTADSLRAALTNVASEKRLSYLVDITTFTHESLLILLRLLALVAKDMDSVEFVYTSALDYGPEIVKDASREGSDRKWLSKGVAEVRSVLGYPGEFLPSRKTHLIVLVGFEHERASKLIEAFEPNILSLGHGKPGTETREKHRIANEHYCKLVRDAAATCTSVQDFDFSCSDPWAAKSAVLQRAASIPGYNVVVAPMNTKISTVGAALAGIQKQAIQLCYAKAMQYNYLHYSTPGNECYLFEVPELFHNR